MFRVLALSVALAGFTNAIFAADANGEFQSTTIDIGVVVSDINRSVKFYTDAIGFKEIKGFEVSAEYCKDVGLTDGKALEIHVLVLGDGPAATKLKLMQVPGVRPKKNDNELINNELGYRYLTLIINDTNAALKRLEAAGVKPIGKGSMPLPKGFPEGMFLTIVRDPDGNMVELIGPKK